MGGKGAPAPPPAPPGPSPEELERQRREREEAEAERRRLQDEMDRLNRELEERRQREQEESDRREQEAAAAAAEAERVRQQNLEQQRTFWSRRQAMETQAEEDIEEYIAGERSRAALTGAEIDFTDEQRMSMIGNRFADIWSAEDEAELTRLQGITGTALGTPRFTRGQTGAFDPETTNIAGVEARRRPVEEEEDIRTVLTDEDYLDLLGAPTILGA